MIVRLHSKIMFSFNVANLKCKKLSKIAIFVFPKVPIGMKFGMVVNNVKILFFNLPSKNKTPIYLFSLSSIIRRMTLNVTHVLLIYHSKCTQFMIFFKQFILNKK